MVLPETSNLPETTPAAGSKSSAGCRPSSKEEKRSRLGLLRLPHEDRFNFLVSESAGKLNISARVAKLADARDLKSRVPKGTYRFNSGPGHQATCSLACTTIRAGTRNLVFIVNLRSAELSGCRCPAQFGASCDDCDHCLLGIRWR